ncbi:MAG: nicotinamide mononucleotide adenylyltransferase, partial [Sphingobacterium sp.]
QIKDYLYKKNIIILRTKYRQKSNPNFDLFNSALEQFYKNTGATPQNTVVLIEILMGNVLDEEQLITDQDLAYFAERAEYLCATGNNIMVSNFRRNNHLAEFIGSFKPQHVGIVTNVSNLKNIFNTQNYSKETYTNELLSYISGMFSKDKKSQTIITTQNVPVAQEAQSLFDFLIKNKYIVDIENYEAKYVKTV